MTKTLQATLAKPALGVQPRKAPNPAGRGTLSLVENTLRLFMWTVVALFTLLLVVVITLG